MWEINFRLWYELAVPLFIVHEEILLCKRYLAVQVTRLKAMLRSSPYRALELEESLAASLLLGFIPLPFKR